MSLAEPSESSNMSAKTREADLRIDLCTRKTTLRDAFGRGTFGLEEPLDSNSFPGRLTSVECAESTMLPSSK